MQFGFFEKESRKPIKISVKKEVYKRAKEYCECCAIKLTMSQGDFHHWRSPTVSPTAKTVQFLCPTCHRKHGHTRKVITHSGILGNEKEIKIIRHKVRRRKKIPTKKKPAKKKTPIRKKRTIKKKPTKRKKKVIKKKTKRKRK